jgi:hypothetical protein
LSRSCENNDELGASRSCEAHDEQEFENRVRGLCKLVDLCVRHVEAANMYRILSHKLMHDADAFELFKSLINMLFRSY